MLLAPASLSDCISGEILPWFDCVLVALALSFFETSYGKTTQEFVSQESCNEASMMSTAAQRPAPYQGRAEPSWHKGTFEPLHWGRCQPHKRALRICACSRAHPRRLGAVRCGDEPLDVAKRQNPGLTPLPELAALPACPPTPTQELPLPATPTHLGMPLCQPRLLALRFPVFLAVTFDGMEL